MCYNLSIGEAEAIIDYDELYARFSVISVDGKDLGAPIDPQGFGSHENENSPGYISWHDFASETGLNSVFYANGAQIPYWTDSAGNKRDGILRQHPGCVALDDQIYEKFKEAQESYVKKSEDDWNVVRLNWLVWWTKWALENCKYPAFANS